MAHVLATHAGGILLVSLTSTFLGACADSSEPTVSRGVVQIADFNASPTTITCPNMTPVYINIHMVNTTADSVALSKVSSTGIYVRSSNPEYVGLTDFVFPALEFSPMILVPRLGSTTTTVVLPAKCPRVSGPIGVPQRQTIATGGFVDAYVTLYVTTTPPGQYATTPLTLRFNYPGGG